MRRHESCRLADADRAFPRCLGAGRTLWADARVLTRYRGATSNAILLLLPLALLGVMLLIVAFAFMPLALIRCLDGRGRRWGASAMIRPRRPAYNG